MADPKTRPAPTCRPMINGCFPKPPFWVTSLLLFGLFGSVLLVATLLRSRFSHSSSPRVHFIQDMDNQPKVKTQHSSEVFADGLATRPKIPGTIARTEYFENPVVATGYTQTWDAAAKKWNVVYSDEIPVKVDADLLKLGQHKFNTYCLPCHGADGAGNGPVNYRAAMLQANSVPGMSWVAPSNLTDAERVKRENGHIFNTITNGIRNMGSYGWAMPDPKERWAVVAYVRALQTSAAAAKSAPTSQPVAMK
ncbi:MAG: cytochrome c [Tepidisphaeraceae bacterium]